MTKQEKYSVLMAVYYKEQPEFLSLAIQSMLDQTVKPAEFVIVEDGPLTPELDTVISHHSEQNPELFKIVKLEKNVGLGPALQRGINECSHELIARMDSDDYSRSERIEKQLRAFRKDPELGMVGTNVEEFEGTIDNVISHVILPETHAQIYRYSKKRCPFRHPALLYKKGEVLKAGNYREFYLCEDYDLFVRMLRFGCKCYNIQEPLTYMRISPDFYRRRGGVKYYQSIHTFKRTQYRNGFLALPEYLFTLIPSLVIALSPNFVRILFYKKVLRK